MMAAGLMMREMRSVGRDVGDQASDFARGLIGKSNTVASVPHFAHFG